MKSKVAKSISVVLWVSLLAGFYLVPIQAGVASAAAPQQADGASSALQQGRRLLKRGKADQALGQLQDALKLYTAANNSRGMAAAHNELGDLYLRQGQYNVALDHYKKAHESFVGAQQKQDVGNGRHRS